VNVLIFYNYNFGIEDVKECFEKKGYKFKAVWSEQLNQRKCTELDDIFEKEFDEGVDGRAFDCVFTFNYSPVISNNCNKRNVPYISIVYDSPQILLYSYTIINPCNYVFIFDKTQYMELSAEGIETVYYCPLAVNTDRLKRMFNNEDSVKNQLYAGDISFIGSMYNEKHNLYDRLCGVNDYTKGYLDAIMKVQRSIYGYFFLEDMLKGDVLDEMMRVCPVKPNEDGVETVQYVYANYFLVRRMATDERTDILSRVGRELGRENKINLYTPDASVRFINVNNKGTVDYYNEMPYVFRNSRINLNITLRSIKSGIPLRCMDICGAGGFLLSNYQADLYDVFVPGEDMVIYDSIDDLMNKCKYYLSHDAERRQIAQNGFGKIEEKHTYDVRFEEIFNMVFN
jgi:spore maturation protein CgeB